MPTGDHVFFCKHRPVVGFASGANLLQTQHLCEQILQEINDLKDRIEAIERKLSAADGKG